mmetsp:Transcript_29437/g.65932  ORF Transcript_29437/g.65932 Transcript_29437/m.65932 type:complete len:207 (-) Transcript_29437:46-666(-)
MGPSRAVVPKPVKKSFAIMSTPRPWPVAPNTLEEYTSTKYGPCSQSESRKSQNTARKRHRKPSAPASSASAGSPPLLAAALETDATPRTSTTVAMSPRKASLKKRSIPVPSSAPAPASGASAPAPPLSFRAAGKADGKARPGRTASLVLGPLGASRVGCGASATGARRLGRRWGGPAKAWHDDAPAKAAADHTTLVRVIVQLRMTL